jgi:AcrR family transcriptional regulator
LPRPKGARDADYESRRSDLLRSMARHMMRRDSPRPSLRELAAAAGVSVPTLRHYFGARPQVIDAIFEERLKIGRQALDEQSRSDRPFAESILDFARALVGTMAAEREVRFGDLIAVSLGEGLIDPGVSRSTLRHVLDPTVATLERRLRDHVARGEMIDTDLRGAALMLVSPLLFASLHQDQMGGAAESPIRLDEMVERVSAAFVRAFCRTEANAEAICAADAEDRKPQRRRARAAARAAS